jgi:hypothetical protein
MFVLVANFFQFKWATTLKKDFFFQIKKEEVSNHNIEGFKQVSKYTTCL